MQGVGLAWVFAVKAAKKGAKLVILRERKKVEAQGLHLLLETEDLVDASAVDLTFARPVEQVGGSLSGSIEAEPSSRLFFVVPFRAFTMGFWQGSSLFWDCDAACVLQAHENCSAGGLVSTPASASFAYFAV